MFTHASVSVSDAADESYRLVNSGCEFGNSGSVLTIVLEEETEDANLVNLGDGSAVNDYFQCGWRPDIQPSLGGAEDEQFRFGGGAG